MRRSISIRTALFCALTSGILYSLAVPPFDWGVLGYLALVPLLLATWADGPVPPVLLGILMGATAAMIMVTPSLYEGMAPFLIDTPWAAAMLALAVPAFYGGAHAGLFAWTAHRISRRTTRPLTAWLWTAAAWSGSELLRSRVGYGNPWVLLAHTQHDMLPVLQVADLGGAAAVSFVVAAVNIAIATVLAYGRRAWSVLPAVATLVAATWIYGMIQLGVYQRRGETAVIVRLVQPNVPEEWRYSLRRVGETLERLRRLTVAEGIGADLVVWPENAVSVSLDGNTMVTDDLGAVLRPGAHLLLGAPRAAAATANRSVLRNAVHLLAHDGQMVGTYDKMRLTPFGEYYPLGTAALRGSLARPEEQYEPGVEPTVFDLGGYRFGAVICLEAAFAEHVRAFVANGAEFLVNVANDGWFGSRPLGEQHFVAASLRAIETRRDLVRVANSGVTALVDARGAVIVRAPRFAEAALTVTVIPRQNRSIYVRVGDLFGWGCVAATIWLLIRREAHKRMAP